MSINTKGIIAYIERDPLIGTACKIQSFYFINNFSTHRWSKQAVSNSPQRNRAITQASYLNICVAESHSLLCISCIFPCWDQIWSRTFVTPWLHIKSSSQLRFYLLLLSEMKYYNMYNPEKTWQLVSKTHLNSSWTAIWPMLIQGIILMPCHYDYKKKICIAKIIYNSLLTKRQWGM